MPANRGRNGTWILVSALVLVSPVWVSGAEPASTALSPAEALTRLTVPADLELDLVLAEPAIAQPLAMRFDERGRLWVVQYMQYPYPAGLRVLSKDKFWRTVFDKVPPPPPYHFVGRDKITIHTDADGDGRFEQQKTFLDGLSIVTSTARGRGGVWVLNPPYLLFYADKDNDDVPDRDPEVHLAGFGLEDTHSVASNIRWGPDGWLYASQGSTVSGSIKRPGLDDDKDPVRSMGQLIWRYHPETRRYEIFAEGGGNAFGVEFDAKGRVYSGHNGGDTRGFHYVQGGYFRKTFGKHGPLSNPYAFGYFPAMKHARVPRFTHAFVIYEAPDLPAHYHGNLFGVAPTLRHVVFSEVMPDGSTFQTKDRGRAIDSRDDWFRPVDIRVGPDGAIYVADFYESQISHREHYEGIIHRESGRIYRLRAKGAKPAAPVDLTKKTTLELIALLGHENKWFRQTALRLIGDRKDAAVVPLLRDRIEKSTGQLALESLWALNLSGGFSDAVAARTLGHADPYVRAWTVRLLGDPKSVVPEIAAQLATLATTEPHVEVRSQLACTARRLPARDGLPIVRNLLARDEDAGDVHLPLLLWWAIEAKAASDREAVLTLFADASLWPRPLVREHVLARVMRRYAMAGTGDDLRTCARLLGLAPGVDDAKRLMKGFEQAFEGRSMPRLPDELVAAMNARGLGSSVALGLRRGDATAVQKALAVIGDGDADPNERERFVRIFGEVSHPTCVPVLLRLAREEKHATIRRAAIGALRRYDDAQIGPSLVALYGDLPSDVRSTAQTVLASRQAWARALLGAIDAGTVSARSIPPDVVSQIALYEDARVAALVAKHWPQGQSGTAAEKTKTMQRLRGVIEESEGSSPYAGRDVFRSVCGACHLLYGEGGQVGPDLTSYQRDDLGYLLLHVVDPSAEIREGFENRVVATTDGLMVNGVQADADNRTVTLRVSSGQTVVIPRNEIDETRILKTSIMPEGLLDPLAPQQVRDLFAYLRSSQPLNE